MTPRILVIDDDPEVQKMISSVFRTEFDCILNTAEDGASGLNMALQDNYSLVIVDLALPKLHGFDLCRELRKKKNSIPIMVLTSRADEIDKVLGFELGADDYITKPFGSREFIARVKALLRRASILPCDVDSILTFGALDIDPDRRILKKDGHEVLLTFVEFELLTFLAKNAGKPFTRAQLLQQVMGYNAGGNEAAVTAHLWNLRSKIEDNPSSPKYIQTVRKVGYRFAEAHELEKT